MSIILNIDTAQETAFVCLSENGNPLMVIENTIQKDHASFLHQAIATLSEKCKINLKNIDAIAVSNGPGSYTGLRVGMSSAKGLCYALNKPLICVESLKIMANDLINKTDDKTLICPLIDARRMEVFTAVYNNKLEEILPATAMILDAHSFSDFLKNNNMIFVGSGADKFQQIINHPNVNFINNKNLSMSMSLLSYTYNQIGNFTNLANSEPLYIKEYKAY